MAPEEETKKINKKLVFLKTNKQKKMDEIYKDENIYLNEKSFTGHAEFAFIHAQVNKHCDNDTFIAFNLSVFTCSTQQQKTQDWHGWSHF